VQNVEKNKLSEENGWKIREKHITMNHHAASWRQMPKTMQPRSEHNKL